MAMRGLRFFVIVADLLFFLFLFLLISSQLRLPLAAGAEISGFTYIDCGALEDSIGWGLTYKSDKYLIESGESQLIAKELRQDHPMQYRSLRSFPEGERNCYTIKLEEEDDHNNTYLVRGVFLYGNYDGKNQTPIFDLYLGVNRWSRVDSDDQIREANYMPTSNYMKLCLINIGNGIPYISALEIRRLEASIYPVPNGYLTSLWRRFDIGGSSTSNYNGYPEDKSYDRLWHPLQYDEWNLTSTREVIPTSSDDLYKVPQVVLATACLPKNSSSPLNYIFTPESEESGPFYFCLHFVEIEKHKDGQFREMKIVLNNDHIITNAIKLDYLKRQTICSNGINVTYQDNYLSIYSTPNSKLPPILNALEVFYSTELTTPTFLQDVNAIMDIKQSYKVRKNWQGDPCIPTSYIWEGLSCSNVASSRIISLNLSSSNLTGDIALSFSNLTQLESLDLSYNDLSGPIPENFAQLLNLKILNLTGNNLTGIIPEALVQKSKDGILLLSVNENPELCLSPPCKEKKKFAIPVLAYIISAIVLFILIVLAILMIIARKKKQNSSTEKNRKGALKPKNRPYSFSEVTSITNNFKTTIGEGGFGKVYLGTLNDNTFVAVKLLSPTSKQGYKEFQAEAQLLMIVHHQNLVSLVGYCDEGDKRVLIYEYMSKGNLQRHLSEKSIKALNWIERVQIAIDAAHGLDYLHNGCKPPIIHRDLKPANILLDDELHAKIADFGLSRTFTNQNESQILTNLAGTLGYVDPEYQSCGKLKKKSDTYSFGIILFELITGKPAITRGPHGNVHILEWVAPILNRGDIQNIVDLRLEGDYNKTSAWKMVEIAVLCTQPTADQRPDMSYVFEQLKACFAVDQGASTGEYSSAVLAESDITPSLR